MSERPRLEVIAVEGLPEVAPGTVLAALLAEALSGERGGTRLLEGDVVVVTSKVVSKAEGRMVRLDDERPETLAALVEAEAVRVLRRRGELAVTETPHGFVCANSGVDRSNVPTGWAVLLPVDPDRSARRIRDGLRARTGAEVAVVISDTFGRPWRRGAVDVAVGCAGIAAVLDLRGEPDSRGRPLSVTEVAVADELAGAAELVMGKASGIPAALVRGVDRSWLRESSVRGEVVRHPGEDLFR